MVITTPSGVYTMQAKRSIIKVNALQYRKAHRPLKTQILDELVKTFSIRRVHKGGAKFDFEKARWFNHQYIQHTDESKLAELAKPYVDAELGIGNWELGLLGSVVPLIKDRCTLLSDFWRQGHFFFATPEIKEPGAIKDKWNDQKQQFFTEWVESLGSVSNWTHDSLEAGFNDLMPKHNLKKGDVLLPLRIMLVGGKYGPGVFNIAEVIGREETEKRIRRVLS